MGKKTEVFNAQIRVDKMKKPFRALKVTDNIFWVGAIDWGIRNFHGYATNRGTTYNAYLILADEVTLVDTVKAPFKDEMFSRIASVIDPEKISYIISNHSEMDHSGCLPETIKLTRPEKVLASSMGVKTLKEHFHYDYEIAAVKDGDRLSLGDMTVQFMETRMLHWPDSMFTYIPEREILFSQDAFGMHLATSQRFDDEIEWSILEEEQAKYFANILLPYTGFIRKLLDKVSESGLKFKMILPDHGPIWRSNIEKVIGLYDKWSRQEPSKKAVIIFDTMWGSTAKMACAITDGLTEGGIDVKLMPLSSCHRSNVVTELLEAGALVVGSPTINNNIFPTVADVLVYLKGLRRKNLIGAAFGSYGWGGEAVKQINEWLGGMGVEVINDGLKVKYVPDEVSLVKCRELGALVAEKLVRKCNSSD